MRLNLTQPYTNISTCKNDVKATSTPYLNSLLPTSDVVLFTGKKINPKNRLLTLMMAFIATFAIGCSAKNKVPYTVQGDDTAWRIVSVYTGKTNAEEIKKDIEKFVKYNNIDDPSLLSIGDIVYLDCLEPSENQTLFDLNDDDNDKDSTAYYTIKSGDTLYAIVKHYTGISNDSEIKKEAKKLAEYNKIDDITKIKVGTKIDLSCLEPSKNLTYDLPENNKKMLKQFIKYLNQ